MKSDIKRFEIIDHRKNSEDQGRRLVIGSNWHDAREFEVELSYQDNNETLKIFLNDVDKTAK